MKNKTFKRSIAIVLCLAILAAIGIGAYLTDTEVKKDVYTVGNVQAEIVANGDMELDNVGALLPGTIHRYERAATNTGINDAYVFMSLTIPYEMVGAADNNGSQIGERVRQLFIPGSADGGFIGSEWKLVDVGHIGQYEIEDNGQYCGEHDQYSVVVGDAITYVYGYIGDNADGALKVLSAGETTSNLVDTMELTNLYSVGKINGSISTKLYAIQSDNVNGGLTDVNGVWAVINKALCGDGNIAATLTYNITNTRTSDVVGYAPLRLVDENGNVVATSVANEEGNGQFSNIPAGSYTIETDVGDLSVNNTASTFRMRRFAAPRSASVEITEEDGYVNLGLTTVPNTLVQGEAFARLIPEGTTSIRFVSNRTIPANAFDVSEVVDRSVMAWSEGTTMYVASADGDMIYANPNSSSMFRHSSSTLTYIGTDNFSTENVVNGAAMFYFTELTNKATDFNLNNVKNWSNTFAETNWISSYTFPDGLEKISSSVFSKSTSLTHVSIPSSVKEIGKEAFFCTGLTSVSIPDGVEVIGSSAFYGCENLTSVSIPASVISMGTGYDNPFGYNLKLTAINVDPANENYVSIDGVLFTKDMKSLVQYPTGKLDTNYTVPNGVEIIPRSAFSSISRLTTIVLPDGLKTIEQQAFASCNNLANISIPSSVTTIGENAFTGTKWLKDKVANEGIVVINGIWIDASLSGDVVLPEGLKAIPDKAFYYNTNMTSVTIPASVTSIGKTAFAGCVNLNSAVFEEGSQLTSIDYEAFYNCSKLTSVDLSNCNKLKTIGERAFTSDRNLTTIILPESVELIDMGAFWGCSALTTINIPASVNQIERMAFFSTPWLENKIANEGVVIVNNILLDASAASGNYVIPNGITELPTYIFNCNENITSVYIPSSVKTIGENVFDNCRNLTTVTFAEDCEITEIGYAMFSGCENLVSVNVPSTVTNINDYAFSYCTNLSSLELPNSVKSIGQYSFSGCEKLEAINLSNVSDLSAYSFYGSGLTSVIIPNHITELQDCVFMDCKKLVEFIVADNHSTFKSVDGVLYSKDMKTLVQYPSGKNETSYTVPEGVETIGHYAFAFDMTLEEIVLPTSIKNLSEYCFGYCSNLKTIQYRGSNGQWYNVGFGLYWNRFTHADFIVNFDYID